MSNKRLTLEVKDISCSKNWISYQELSRGHVEKTLLSGGSPPLELQYQMQPVGENVLPVQTLNVNLVYRKEINSEKLNST